MPSSASAMLRETNGGAPVLGAVVRANTRSGLLSLAGACQRSAIRVQWLRARARFARASFDPRRIAQRSHSALIRGDSRLVRQ